MPENYAGIGSRKTPDNILALMEKLGYGFAREGYCLRSGGAVGADTAFEIGCDLGVGFKEIFRPFQATNAAREEIRKHLEPRHFDILVKKGYLDLHARNCFQVLGLDLKTPSKFVICWTPDGAISKEECNRETGGTGSAVKVASAYGIPVLNLAREDHLYKALRWIS